MAQGELRTEDLFGTAKKWTLEMEALPLEQHGALVNHLQIGYQTRNLKLQREEHLAQVARAEKQQELQERGLRMHEDLTQKQRALEMQPHLVSKEPVTQ